MSQLRHEPLLATARQRGGARASLPAVAATRDGGTP
jgi:hypothetical protein